MKACRAIEVEDATSGKIYHRRRSPSNECKRQCVARTCRGRRHDYEVGIPMVLAPGLARRKAAPDSIYACWLVYRFDLLWRYAIIRKSLRDELLSARIVRRRSSIGRAAVL